MKNNGLWYTRKINRPIAYILAKHLVGIHPNYVTILGFLLFSISCILFAFDNINSVAFAICLLMSYVFDSADGEVARLSAKTSTKGEWLDHSLDSVRIVILMPAVYQNMVSTDNLNQLVSIGILLNIIFLSAWFNFNILWSKIVKIPNANIITGSKLKSILSQPLDTGLYYFIFIFAGHPFFGYVITLYGIYVALLFLSLNLARTTLFT